MTTPKLQMPELVVGQAGKELTHNQALAVLDQLAQAVVVDKDLTSPPGSPANGAMYIVAASAAGDWSGQSGKLAYWLTSVAAWTFITPADGWSVWVTDEAVRYERKSGAWVIVATGGGASLPVVQPLSSTRTLALVDINTFNVNSTTNNYTATIPTQATVAWTADAEMHFLPSNTGDITITAASGVSLNGVSAGSLTLSTRNGAASLKRTASDSWWLGGVIGTAADQRTALGLGTAAVADLQTSVTDTTSGRAVIQGGSNLSRSDTVQIGYGSGAGGSVTQSTSKSTAVTLNKPSGRITLHNEALAAGASVMFALNNSLISTTTQVITHGVGTASVNYSVECANVTAGVANIRVTNRSAGSLSDAAFVSFTIIQGANN